MIDPDAFKRAFSSMILSASGWRGIFAADGGEESHTPAISPEHAALAAIAGYIFSEYIKNIYINKNPVILVGMDSRPTGPAIAGAVLAALAAENRTVKYTGVIAAPEIMAYAREIGKNAPCGFVYISASHNPIAHNGIKFGLCEGGVLPPSQANALTAAFKALCETGSGALPAGLERALYQTEPYQNTIRQTVGLAAANKAAAETAYAGFTTEVITGTAEAAGQNAVIEALRARLAIRPIKIAADFNGSARAASIDRAYLSALGLGFSAINEPAGAIAHRIVPEGEGLEPCRLFLDSLHRQDAAYLLGYTPDCDGDRGNLVIWDDRLGAARALEAQEVFALAVLAELSFLAASGADMGKAILAANDPTSMRVDEIAAFFGVQVRRAEVGEANVVDLAAQARNEGFTVRALGEGAAGGVIIHPSKVRDPLDTLCAVVKLLVLRGEQSGQSKQNRRSSVGGCLAVPGLFELWCRVSNQTYRENWTLADILDSIPRWTTTGAYSPAAIMHVNTAAHDQLKARYQQIFLRDWQARRATLGTEFGIQSWKAFRYNGVEENQTDDFAMAGRGGLKIIFYGKNARPTAAIWMRGSATEPVFRIMADVKGSNPHFENTLLQWQRSMVAESDIM